MGIDLIYECIDCGHTAPLVEMHHRSHGGFDCPECYGEVERPESIWRGDDEESKKENDEQSN